MEQAAIKKPWRGRIVLVLGIILLGVTLRHAVTGLSPLLPVVREELGMGVGAASFLGMLPTLAFGVAGFLTPVIMRAKGPELTAFLAMVLAVIGTVARVLGDSIPLFLLFSVIALFGMGMGNVVGAPLVKKYFPDRQATMLTVFALLMQAGATLPAMTAMPIYNAAGWRLSLASWAVISLLAAVPWAIALLRLRRASASAATTGAASNEAVQKFGLGGLLKSRISMGTALFYAMASLNTYAMLAWFPTILGDRGMELGEAASAFSVFTFLTLPMALVTPLIASRMKNVFPLAAVLALTYPIGYIGLLTAPDLNLLWAVIMGMGGGAFPLAITMFNRNTRSAAGSAALAGFAMGVGYLFGTLGPLLGGMFYSMTGGWDLAIIVFALTGTLALIGAKLMTPRRGVLEDGFAQVAA